ncbi:MAG: hydrogenase maturation protease [Bryobacterales bacterium]|nr:hydrogenase maturation protease [Bryobacterales bacterium]
MTIIACGASNRADDEAGLLVASLLQLRGIPVTTYSNGGLGLLQVLSSSGTVLLIDAVQSGRPPGTITVCNASNDPLPIEPHTASSHGFGVAHAIELARTLGNLPESLIVIGIEGRCFAIGAAMSPEVRSACERVAARIVSSWPHLPADPRND